MVSVIEPEKLLENEQTQELNGLITVIATAPYSSELEGAFYIGSRDIDDNNIFWLYKVDKRVKQDGTITLYGTYSLFDDLKAYDVIRDKRPKNVSALGGISIVLEGSRWKVGNVTSTKLGTENFYYISRLEAFWKYLEAWGVEFKPRMTYSKGKITGRYIDIADRLSDDYGKWYEYGNKLMQVTAEQASDSLYTAFIGRGKGEEVGDGFGRRIGFEKVVWTKASGKPVDKPINQDFIEIPEATAEYGYSDGKPRTTVVIFEETEDVNLLIQQTYDYAINECRPKLQMKANVIENGLSELGEVCAIIRGDLGIRYKTRVFKIVRNFLNKNEKSVEFGDEIVISSAKRNSNTANAIKKQEEQTLYWLDNIRQQVIDSYFNEDGYNYDLDAANEHDLPAGYYSFDRPIDQNPTKVVYTGAGKIMIANSKLPNGQWKWTTAINGDGANLSAVNTGILQAGRIKSAVDGSYWDLDSGVLNLKGGTFTGSNYNLDLNLGVQTFYNPVSSSGDLIFTQGKIQFNREGTGKRIIQYHDEGIMIKHGANNEGYARNTSIHLQGDKAYVQFISNAGFTLQRIEGDELHLTAYVNDSFRVQKYYGSGEWRPIKARSFETSGTINNMEIIENWIRTTDTSDTNIYIEPSRNGNVRIADRGLKQYHAVDASNFNVSSERRFKTDIKEYENALSLINSFKIYSYKKNNKKEYGIIADESPIQLLSKEQTTVDLYSFISLIGKSNQELSELVFRHEKKINELQNKIKG